jgi:anti-sigma regulatory factor (Ser/Thr protein kinase)
MGSPTPASREAEAATRRVLAAGRPCAAGERSRARKAGGPAPSRVPSVVWWTREFPGDAGQVREVRHWIEDLLPRCGALDEVVLLASEACTNAVVHTRSGQAGRFSVDVEWSAALARVVVGDQGSADAPAVGRTGEAERIEERGRGLRLVDAVSDGWGTARHPAGRCVWFDVGWQARGGPSLRAPGGVEAMGAGSRVIRRVWPGTTVWWGHVTGTWWAVVPRTAGAAALIDAPTPEVLISKIVGRVAWDRRPGGRDRSPDPAE